MTEQAMTAEEARAHLERLGLTQGEFTRLMGVNDRTGRRWLSLTDALPMPRAVAIALELLTPKTVKKWMPETPLPSELAELGEFDETYVSQILKAANAISFKRHLDFMSAFILDRQAGYQREVEEACRRYFEGKGGKP